jgi:hypothetical protein
MATTNYKVLAQNATSATTNTDLLTVGAGKQVVISTLVVCNRGGSATTFRIAVRPDAAVLANTHYIAYDVTVAANDSTNLTLGITMDASDVLTVYAGSANLTFAAFGSEIA